MTVAPPRPLAEDLAAYLQMARSRAELFSPAYLNARLSRRGRRISATPQAPEVIVSIKFALQHKRPFSVIRIGDGEMNLMSLTQSSPSPVVDHWAAHWLMLNQGDKGELTLEGLRDLGHMVCEAISTADVVGVVGLWPETDSRPDLSPGREWWERALTDDPRGATGQISARIWADDLVDHLPLTTMIASAHLYLGVCAALIDIVPMATRITCVTSQPEAADLVRGLAPTTSFRWVPVGQGDAEAPDRVRGALAASEPGELCLIGAGPWSEPYCAWAKAAGAVAIDIGSGFDLLAHKTTRPVHVHPATLALLQNFPGRRPV